LIRTDFDLLDECTNDPAPCRRVAGIQPLPNKPGELFDLANQESQLLLLSYFLPLDLPLLL